MGMFFDLALPGTLQREDDTTHVVNIWHIPDGCDYVNSSVLCTFFSDEKSANAFHDKWAHPPEMAMVMTVAQYDEIQQKIHLRTIERR